ncbi:hypothetical protein [Klebsiella variicola]|nr:hypothetical protein [Klebsiella variicola subsp. variicola]
MTTDITELAQSLKAAAVRVIKNYDSEWFEAGHQICTVHKSKINLISLANPVNVLALVEALEKAQQFIARQGQILLNQDECLSIRRGELEFTRRRIAELESRTVKLPQRHSMLLREDFNEDYHTEMAFKADEVQASLAAAGIKVEAE